MAKRTSPIPLRSRIESLEILLAENRRRLDEVAPEMKDEAAGELEMLSGRLAKTKERLSRLQAEAGTVGEAREPQLQKDVEYLEAEFELWAEKQT